jgi:hypothetical protein
MERSAASPFARLLTHNAEYRFRSWQAHPQPGNTNMVPPNVLAWWHQTSRNPIVARCKRLPHHIRPFRGARQPDGHHALTGISARVGWAVEPSTAILHASKRLNTASAPPAALPVPAPRLPPLLPEPHLGSLHSHGAACPAAATPKRPPAAAS